MSIKYILDKNNEPKREDNVIRWARWLEHADRTVEKTFLTSGKPEVFVSTVFLGLDHNFYDKGPPILWETMVFGGPMDQHMTRCAGSREQAQAMHVEMVNRVVDLLTKAT